MAVWLQMVLDRVELVVKVSSVDLYNFALAQLHGLADLSAQLVPDGKLFVTQEMYTTRLNYFAAKKRKIADLIMGATKTNHRYFKLVLYPSNFKDGDFSKLKELLEVHFDVFNYENLFHSAHVTYIEFAADLLFREKSGFIAMKPKTALSEVFVEADGQLGTSYLGSAESALRFRIYDKTKQLNKKGQKSPFHVRTRIEACLRRTKLKPSELHQIANPFAKLQIIEVAKAVSALPGPEWAAFLEACQQHGAPMALSAYKKPLREKYRKALRASKAIWWNPHFIWGGLAKALEAITP